MRIKSVGKVSLFLRRVRNGEESQLNGCPEIVGRTEDLEINPLHIQNFQI